MFSAHVLGVIRIDLGKWSIRNIKRLHLLGAARTNFPKYPGFFGKAVRENALKCDDRIIRVRFIEYFLIRIFCENKF